MNRMYIPTLSVLAAVLALTSMPAEVAAQTASEVAAARRLFRQGLAAARRDRWEEARDAFQRSYEVAPRPNTLVNLAGAQAQLGQLVAATETYQRFLVEANDRRSRALRPRAEQELAELELRLAQLVLRIDGLDEHDVVRLGERELGHAALGLELPVDPGPAQLTVERDGERLLDEPLRFEESQRQEVDFAVASLEITPEEGPASAAPDAAFEPDPATETEGGDDTLLIVGLTIGAVVAVGAAAAIVGVVVANDGGTFQGNAGTIEFD